MSVGHLLDPYAGFPDNTKPTIVQEEDPGQVGRYIGWINPVTGAMKVRSADNLSWVDVGGGASATPSGPATGVLGGTYPGPTFAVDMATQAELDAVSANIPQGSGDAPAVGGGVFSEEWSTTTHGMTANGAVDVMDSHTTKPSHYQLKHSSSVSRYAFRNFVPGSGAFDVRLKLAEMSAFDAATYVDTALVVADDTVPTNGAMILISASRSSNQFRISTYDVVAASLNQHGSNWENAPVPLVLRIQRDGSNSITTSWSVGGYAFIVSSIWTQTFTVAKVGVRVGSDNTNPKVAFFDYLRAN